MAESAVSSTSTSSVCGTPVNSSLPFRSTVSTEPEGHLRRNVITSACMEALMRHYLAADEVSRLTAAPRRPSTDRMYDSTRFRFVRWAAGLGF